MSVRPIRLADIPCLIDLGELMHTEGAYRFLPFERARCEALLRRCIDQPASWCGLVAEADDGPAGMLIGVRSPYVFCSESVASDVILFVRAGSRGARHATAMVDDFIAWARRHGAREVCISTSLNVDVPGTDAFVGKLGFVRVGGVFKQRLDTADSLVESIA